MTVGEFQEGFLTALTFYVSRQLLTLHIMSYTDTSSTAHINIVVVIFIISNTVTNWTNCITWIRKPSENSNLRECQCRAALCV